MTTEPIARKISKDDVLPPVINNHGRKFFVRIVWDGEPAVNPDEGFIVKESLGTFIEGLHSPLAAIAAVGGMIVDAGAHITDMHYVAAMDITEPAIEARIRDVEKILVEKFDKAYIDDCVARSEQRMLFARKAAEHKAAAKKKGAVN